MGSNLDFMNTPRILIIEDEPKVAGFIQKGLEASGYLVEIARDGIAGRDEALIKPFDLILLDINLPKLNGFEVCKAIRIQNPAVPILMLTAMGTTDDKLEGFNRGADDYLVKPFEFRELLARVKVLLKRVQKLESPSTVLRIANLELNRDKKSVRRGNVGIDLTAKEFLLLEYLLLNVGKVISKKEIAEKIWGITFDTGTNVIEVYINFLRKKVDRDFTPKLIHTHVGMGYTIKEDDTV